MSQYEKTKSEIEHWFFVTYFNDWVAVGKGESDEGPEFILKYWSTPMFVTGALGTGWLTKGEDVVGLLLKNHIPLQEAGYTHTVVPDKKVVAYNEMGGSIESIWSRRSADETEIQRMAVHFDVAKIDDKWMVVGIQGKFTDAAVDKDSLELAWKG